jgi:CheY-like chemotaxis protein
MNDNEENASGSAETILVVEDEVLVRTAISEYLRHCGYRVVEAVSADEAITLLGESSIKIDIVFSDISMPGSYDGFGLSKWVHTNRPELQIILTGTVEKAAHAAGDLCESGPHLEKPYEPQQIIEWIKRLKASN